MAKPLDAHTDKELEGALAEGGLTERKAAVAEEILRRRQDAKAEAIKEKNGWIGGILATLATVVSRRNWSILVLMEIEKLRGSKPQRSGLSVRLDFQKA